MNEELGGVLPFCAIAFGIPGTYTRLRNRMDGAEVLLSPFFELDHKAERGIYIRDHHVFPPVNSAMPDCRRLGKMVTAQNTSRT